MCTQMRNKIAFWESSQVVKTGKYTLHALQISYRRKQFSVLLMCVWSIKCKQMVCLLTCWWYTEVYKNTKMCKSWFQVLKTLRSSCSSFKSIHRPAFKNDSFTLCCLRIMHATYYNSSQNNFQNSTEKLHSCTFGKCHYMTCNISRHIMQND